MNKNALISTPTKSSAPSAQPQNPENPGLESVPTNRIERSGPSQTPLPTIALTKAIGFEVNLGPITLTDFDLTNSTDVGFLAGIIAPLAAAITYRAYIRSRQHQMDKTAFETAEATFGATIDQIKEQAPVAMKIDLLDRLLNPTKVKAHDRVKKEFKRLRKQLHSFENEYGGSINVDLEKAIHHLSELAADESPNLDAVTTAYDGVISVAKRLNLPVASIHHLSSISFQLKQAKKA